MQLFKRAALKAFYNKHRYAIAGLAVCFAFVLLVATNASIRYSRHVALRANVASANLSWDGGDDACHDSWWWYFVWSVGVDICGGGTSTDTGGGGDNSGGGSSGDCYWDFSCDDVDLWGTGTGGNNTTHGLQCDEGWMMATGGYCVREDFCSGPDAWQYPECGAITVNGGGPGPTNAYNNSPGWPIGQGYNPAAGANGNGGTGNDGGAGPAVTPPPISCATGYHWTEFGCMIDPDAEPTPTPTIHTPTPTVRCWDGSIPGGDYAGCDPVPIPTPTVTVVATPVPDCAGEANRDCNYDYATPSNTGTTDNNGTGGSGAFNWLRRIIRGIF